MCISKFRPRTHIYIYILHYVPASVYQYFDIASSLLYMITVFILNKHIAESYVDHV